MTNPLLWKPDLEAVARIIDPEAYDKNDECMRLCIQNGQPPLLAAHFAGLQYGDAMDNALTKALAILALPSVGEGLEKAARVPETEEH